MNTRQVGARPLAGRCNRRVAPVLCRDRRGCVHFRNASAHARMGVRLVLRIATRVRRQSDLAIRGASLGNHEVDHAMTFRLNAAAEAASILEGHVTRGMKAAADAR
jgi:hypothetical protein